MMRPMRPGLALVLAIAACGGPVGPAAPQDRARVRLVRCKPAVPLPTLGEDVQAFGGLIGTATGVAVFGTLGGGGTGIGGLLEARAPLDLGPGGGAGGGGAPANPPEVDPAAPWTPFAMDPAEAASATEQAARAAEGALRKKLGAIDACFASSPVTGSLRAMLAVDSDGALTSVRAGGLGDRALEACVENAVTGLRVVLPQETSSELACDLSRGDAQPWRVTADRGGYGVVEISRTRVRHGDQTLSLGEEPDPLTDHSMYLLIADADAPGALLSLAMRWTDDADTTLVAVRPARPPGAPAQLLGAGFTAMAALGGYDEEVRATLEVGAAAVTACASRWRHAAKLADPAAIDGAAQKLAARCRALACSTSLVIGVGRDAIGKDLVEVAGAARRAGFERVLFLRGRGGAPLDESDDGSPSAGCAPPDRGDEP
jgi:hypothetical protein